MKAMMFTCVLLGFAASPVAAAKCDGLPTFRVCTTTPGNTVTIMTAGHRTRVSSSNANAISFDRHVLRDDNSLAVIGTDTSGTPQILFEGGNLLNPTSRMPVPNFQSRLHDLLPAPQVAGTPPGLAKP